jgi:hypothetical protein
MRALREVSAECDTDQAYVVVTRWDISAQVCTASSQSGWLKDLGWTLDEHEALLYL